MNDEIFLTKNIVKTLRMLDSLLVRPPYEAAIYAVITEIEGGPAWAR